MQPNQQFNSEIQKRRSSGFSFDRGKIPEKEKQKKVISVILTAKKNEDS